MNHAGVRTAVAWALALAAPWATGQTRVDLAGTSTDGLAVSGHIDANFSATASLQETLADGTLHNRFTLLANGVIDFMAGWQIQVGPGLGFYAFAEGYPYDPSGAPQVDVYLTPDGRSTLHFDWAVQSPCHGGCISNGTLHLDLSSDTGSLFGAQIDSGVFSRYTAGTGRVTDVYQYFGPEGGTYAKERSFTLSAVPEPHTALLGVLGLIAVLGHSYFRRASLGMPSMGHSAVPTVDRVRSSTIFCVPAGSVTHCL